MTLEKEKESVLAHYGVKGMKWGQRRAAVKAERAENTKKARMKGYSRDQKDLDTVVLGRSTVRRIEKRIAAGEDLKKVRSSEELKHTAKNLAVAVAVLATPKLMSLGTKALVNAAASKQAKDGAKAAADLFANSKGITSYETIALAFDGSRGVWG